MSARPSRGVILGGIAMLVFSMIQMFFTPSVFREYSFLPKWAVWASFEYFLVYDLAAIAAVIGTFKLEKWGRGLMIILLVAGLADKAVFIPVRQHAIERVSTDPRISSMLISEYRRLLAEKKRPVQQVPDDVLLRKAVRDLHTAQQAIEVTWILFLLVLLAFYSNPRVRSQFSD
jgi:hypothetical protein